MLKNMLILLFIAAAAMPMAATYSAVLAKYNVSTSVSNILVPVQLHVNGDNYTLLYLHNNPYLLANDTNDTLVFSSSEASAVAGNYIIGQAINSSYIKTAYAQMQNYEQSSASSINSCAQVTGLSGTVGTSFSCTLANYCESCSAIPACKKVIVKTGGPTGAFGLGIQQFEAQYTNLTDYYAEFYSAINGINQVNAGTSVAELNGAFSQISSITKNIYQNPIFPPTANITASMFAADCGLPQNIANLNNYSLSNAPWFCNAVGYCPLTTYNYTALSSISASLSAISSLPITATGAATVTANLSNNDFSYYKPILYKEKAKEYANILNTTLIGYSTLVNSSIALSAHIGNLTFVNALSALQKSYAQLSANYTSLNLTMYNKTIAVQLKNLSVSYSGINKTYSQIKGLAASNTKLIIAYQLDSAAQPSGLSAIAFSQYNINNQISGKVNNTKATYSSLQSINKSLASMQPSSPALPEAVRAVDSGIVTYMLAGSSASYAAKTMSVPSYAALISAIIGIMLLIILSIVYMRLNKKHRIRAKPMARRNWRIIFAIAVLLFIAYVLVTYYSAASAASFAPASAFLSAVHSSKSVYVINNGTSPGITNCSKNITAKLSAQGKATNIVNISSSGLCSINGFVGNESSCLDHITANGYPVIVLSNSNSSSIHVYSFYGSALFASGSSSFVNECIPAFVIG